MDLLITILSGIAILFGIGLVFANGTGSLLAGIISLIAGIAAYDQNSILPLVIGFIGLWVLRLLGFEKK